MIIVQQGAMGRDVAAAENFAEHGHEVYAVAEHNNPSLMDICEATGGSYLRINDICDTDQVSELVESANPDMFVTNHDDSLAAGVVDAVRDKASGADRRLPLLIPSPDKEASRIEWDKFHLREILDDINPDYNPAYRTATIEAELEEGMKVFQQAGTPVAIKPRNLTGGKGVKVMGPHLDTHRQAEEYGHKVLDDTRQAGLLIEQAMEGHEFTIMAYSDGETLAFAPATYDYPQREDGDEGPGTGGMGSFTMPAGEQLPFMSETDYDEAVGVMTQVQDRLRSGGTDFKGILYGSFFMTEEGLKVTEFNARAGDPEMMNVINLLEDGTDLAEILSASARGELEKDSVRFKQLASAALYLVSPDYAYRQGEPHDFTLDLETVKRHRCKHYFVAAERGDGEDTYRSVGSSRTLALAALDKRPWDARVRIHRAIKYGFDGDLQFRRDIADKKYIQSLAD